MSDAPLADTSPAVATVPCSGCATPIDPASAYFSVTGDMLCTRCNAAADIHATEGRATSAMVAVGYGTLATGLCSLVFNPMTLLSFLTVLQGSLTLVSLLRGDWYRRRLGKHYYLILLSTIVGTAIGALPYLVILLAILLAI